MYVRSMAILQVQQDSYVQRGVAMAKNSEVRAPYSARTIYVSVFYIHIILLLLCGNRNP